MPVKPGDFLLVNFTLKVKESGETVDTTYDAVAKDARLHREDSTYGPRFIILGEGWLPKGLEDSLVGVDIGKQTTVELPPEKGYGARDPSKKKLVPLRRFRDKETPLPGERIELDGRPAVVRAVGAGRVQVDYNHPLAGRTLIYDVSIEKILDDDNKKVLNIISRRIPEVKNDKFTLTRQDSDLTIDVPEEAFYLSGLQIAKKAVSSDIQKYFPAVGGISFRETFKRPAEVAPPQPTEPAKPSTAEPAQETQAETKEDAQTADKPEKPKTRTTRTKPAAGKSRRRVMAGSENQR